jgi:hypothetical protein
MPSALFWGVLANGEVRLMIGGYLEAMLCAVRREPALTLNLHAYPARSAFGWIATLSATGTQSRAFSFWGLNHGL